MKNYVNGAKFILFIENKERIRHRKITSMTIHFKPVERGFAIDILSMHLSTKRTVKSNSFGRKRIAMEK